MPVYLNGDQRNNFWMNGQRVQNLWVNGTAIYTFTPRTTCTFTLIASGGGSNGNARVRFAIGTPVLGAWSSDAVSHSITISVAGTNFGCAQTAGTGNAWSGWQWFLDGVGQGITTSNSPWTVPFGQPSGGLFDLYHGQTLRAMYNQ